MTIPFNINTYTGSVQLNGLDYEVKAQDAYDEYDNLLEKCLFVEIKNNKLYHHDTFELSGDNFKGDFWMNNIIWQITGEIDSENHLLKNMIGKRMEDINRNKIENAIKTARGIQKESEILTNRAQDLATTPLTVLAEKCIDYNKEIVCAVRDCTQYMFYAEEKVPWCGEDDWINKMETKVREIMEYKNEIDKIIKAMIDLRS